MAVMFDLLGTLVGAKHPSDPGSMVTDALREYNVAAPDNRDDACHKVHIDAPEGVEVPLPAYVAAAPRSQGVDSPGNAARCVVIATSSPEATIRPDTVDAIAATREVGAVGPLLNCSVPEPVARMFIRSDFDRRSFGDITTNVACSWRRPHRQAFEVAVHGLGVDTAESLCVGDDPGVDGGVEAVGSRFVNLRETALELVAVRLRAGEDPCP